MQRALGDGAARRPHHERHLVLLHVGAEGDGSTGAHLHLGPALSEGLRRFVGCDARIRPVMEAGGRPVNLGRAFRTVPERTRMVIEERDRGCRVPGCERTRGLHVHHIEHWEDGGSSASRPPARQLWEACAAPPAGGCCRPWPRHPHRGWSHPTGEHLDTNVIFFHEPAT